MRTVLWIVTLLRVALIPVFVELALRAQEVGNSGDVNGFRIAALAVLFVMGSTDVLDGWIARRFSLTTQAGAVVDAVADKVVQVVLVAFFTLSVGPAFGTLPLWFLVVIFGRDLVLLVGVLVLRVRYGPLQVTHRPHGRVASLAVFGVLFWVALDIPTFGPALTLALGVTAALSVATATRYALDGAAQGTAMGH